MPGRPAARRPTLAPATLARRARSIRVTAYALVAVLAAGVAGALAVGGPSIAAGGGHPAVAPRPTSPATTPPSAVDSPASPADVVSGTVTTAAAGGAAGPALDTPLVITVPVRGQGGATILGVDIGGKRSSIAWDAGEPLALDGHGAIVPGPVDVTVDASGSTWGLDGGPRALSRGAYRADAPVAVGQSGLAQPESSAEFTAGPGSVLETSGGATVHLPPRNLHLAGTGPLTLTGALQVRTGSGTEAARSLRLDGGPYVIDLIPVVGGLAVRATLHGTLSLTGPHAGG